LRGAAPRAKVRAMTTPVLLSALSLFAIALVLADPAAAREDGGRFEYRTLELSDGTHRYAVWLPPGFKKRPDGWPTIVFLHGSGECGSDGEAPVRVGLGPVLQAHPDRWPFVVVFPQKPTADEEWWEHESLVFAALDDAAKHFRADPARAALAGMSQGGHGTWMIGARHPDRWRCLVPVCGYGRAQTVATRIRDVPTWCFQGLKDDVVLPHETQEIARWMRELKASGGLDTTNFRATFYPDANHNSWDPAFAEEELPKWIARWLAPR
jgi:predicted peptidase